LNEKCITAHTRTHTHTHTHTHTQYTGLNSVELQIFVDIVNLGVKHDLWELNLYSMIGNPTLTQAYIFP